MADVRLNILEQFLLAVTQHDFSEELQANRELDSFGRRHCVTLRYLRDDIEQIIVIGDIGADRWAGGAARLGIKSR
ncbi:hypothetical protein TP47_00810 (plasmid) [Xanthomonas citri pv. aurantifolii]|nr:hypothetical protein TP47_00810 [Xanthomonas citri pv. aurantifolii]